VNFDRSAFGSAAFLRDAGDLLRSRQWRLNQIACVKFVSLDQIACELTHAISSNGCLVLRWILADPIASEPSEL
jgi:hypothetical protein